MQTLKRKLSSGMFMGLLWVIFSMIFILNGCAPSIKTRADYDTNHDFSQMQTFSWLKPQGNIENPMEKHPLVAKRVKQAIAGEMEEKGYTLNAQNPDFYVVFFGSSEDRRDVKSWNSPYAGWGYRGWAYGWGAPDITVSQYKEATLVVDIIDAKSDELVWRGSGKGRVRDNPKNMDERIQHAVAKVLEEFPPQ